MLSQNLQDALTAYNSSNRINYPLNGRQVTNLDAVEHYLHQAISLSPKHFGLPLTIANMQTFRGNISEALNRYHQSLHSATNDHDRSLALIYLTVWHHYNGDTQQADKHLNQLSHINPEQGIQIQSLLERCKAILERPLCHFTNGEGIVPSSQPNVIHAIVIMGYVLNNDGSMANQLIQRLKIAKQLTQQFPDSLLFVTGGLAKGGTTESQQMKHWLIKHGVTAKKIFEEDQAVNTIDNATLSLKMLEKHQIQYATVVSGSNHIHRSLILFEVLQWKANKKRISFNHCTVKDGLLSAPRPIGQIRLNCYIDALRAYGLPAFNCDPLIQL